MAGNISGYLEYNYSNLDSKSTDAAGTTTRTRTESFGQKYRLSLSQKPYPNLTVNGGGFFEIDKAFIDTDGQRTDTTATKIRPYVDVTLSTPLVTAGVGYNRNEEEQKTAGQPSSTLVRENSSAHLGYTPAGFPSLDLLFTRTSSYDKEKRFQDTVEDRLNAGARYQPAKPVDLRYQGTFGVLTDNLRSNTVRDSVHDGRITYADSYWKNRAAFYGSYDLTLRQTEVSSSGQGEISFLLSPVAGLSALSDTPERVALATNNALIDGNLSAGAGVNIGVPPAGSDARPRNIGLDFFAETEFNTLLVWVDRELPASVAGSFSWNVYTSGDGQNWTLRQTVSPGVFGPFLNRFEIDIANLTSRFVKVVVRPLSPAVPGAADLPAVQVTEIQALVRRPAGQVSGRTSQTSHVLNANARVSLLERPNLNYEFSYFLTKSSPASSRYTVSNALSASHRFNPVFTGTARFAREDGKEDRGSRVAYVYNASLQAVPFKTLSHSLVFSGREETIGGAKNDTNSLFLNNSAELYKGVEATLSGGATLAHPEGGGKDESTTLLVGTRLTPHRTLTATVTYSGTTTKHTGGGNPDETTYNRTGEGTIAFNPVRTVYLFGSYAIVWQQGKEPNRTRNYSASWSPFPDGTLHFNFAYSETIRSADNGRDRAVTPSLRWDITPRAYVDLSYQALTSEVSAQKTESRIFSTNLKLLF